MKLYGYFRSSAAFRVRIALNLKKLDYESAFIHLRRGDQRQPGFRGVNPQGLVPALETDGTVLLQSLPIIEYLDETHPSPPLLPSNPQDRARVRALVRNGSCAVPRASGARSFVSKRRTRRKRSGKGPTSGRLSTSQSSRRSWLRRKAISPRNNADKTEKAISIGVDPRLRLAARL